MSQPLRGNAGIIFLRARFNVVNGVNSRVLSGIPGLNTKDIPIVIAMKQEQLIIVEALTDCEARCAPRSSPST